MFNALFISLKNLFSKPNTCSYPAPNSPKKAPNYRGLIVFDEPKCIYCLQCEDVCPPRAIRFTQNLQDGKFTYHYNPYLCIFCGECVRICPDKADALSQIEMPAEPETDGIKINDEWSLIEKEAEESKIKYKEIKKAQKEAEQTATEQPLTPLQ